MSEIYEKEIDKKVVRRDGKKVDKEGKKIALAIKKGFDSVNRSTEISKYNEEDINKVTPVVAVVFLVVLILNILTMIAK